MFYSLHNLYPCAFKLLADRFNWRKDFFLKTITLYGSRQWQIYVLPTKTTEMSEFGGFLEGLILLDSFISFMFNHAWILMRYRELKRQDWIHVCNLFWNLLSSHMLEASYKSRTKLNPKRLSNHRFITDTMNGNGLGNPAVSYLNVLFHWYRTVGFHLNCKFLSCKRPRYI